MEYEAQIGTGNQQGVIRSVAGNLIPRTGNLLQETFTPLRQSWREAKMLTLLRPTQRNGLTELLEVQILGLASFQNRFDDVRREECAPENFADITFRQSHLASQRSHIGCFSLNHRFIPAGGPCVRLDQRGLL